MLRWLHWLLFWLIPATLITSAAISAVWGDNGVLARYRLQQELADAGQSLATVERENQRLLREIHRLDKDPVVMERLVADEIGWARPDAVLYRFEGTELEEP